MPIRKYANATPPGGDSDNTVSEYSANHSAYTETTNTINSTVSDYSVSADSVCSDDTVARARDYQDATSAKVSEMLTRMSPAYKSGKARRQADPLGWRVEKILRRLRPMLSTENFLEVSTEFSKADAMERAALAHRLEEWLKHTHGYGDT